MKSKLWKILGLFLLITCICTACKEEVLLLEENAGMQSEITDDEALSDMTGETDLPEMIYVHACGAVNTPGVYAVPAGSRIYEVIEKAGGFDEEADAEVVNLVEEISDGEQIRIPFIGEKEKMPEDKLIDINQADADTLCQIPGIGQTRAEAIVNYRTENGDFQSTEELMQVPGIKEGIYAKIYPYIECR